jgi:hypothetical protein
VTTILTQGANQAGDAKAIANAARVGDLVEDGMVEANDLQSSIAWRQDAIGYITGNTALQKFRGLQTRGHP